MKISFEGRVRDLDLLHVTLRHAVAVQEFTGLALLPWQQQLGVGMRAEPGWITGMAAAHWLMLAQAGEDPPPLDGSYDCDVLGFALAYLTAIVEHAKAKAEQPPERPDPTVPPGRPARSSRRTATPKTAQPEAAPSPSTGS